ncbi:MAG: hypothetical protein HOH43_18785 [Candidatus Latescibacteria bacterium]|jgi:hypothetical protein|nr:hypothetical protein [Candidatus Latescibacterota bacterium]
MSDSQTDIWFDHQTLLRDTSLLLTVYDKSAQGVLDLALKEGYFEGIDPALLKWPLSQTADGPMGLEALGYRVKLIGAIYEGVPKLRDVRLTEAYQQFREVTPAYHESTKIYAQVKRDFLKRGAGTEDEFLKLYQTIYVQALRAANVYTPDEGEAALERARLSRVPLSHAVPVAERLKTVVPDDDPQWSECYQYQIGEEKHSGALREIFLDIAGRTLDYLAVGEHIAVRYNTYNNFAWFGSAIWKILSEAEFLVESVRLGDPPGVINHQLDGLKDEVLQGQGMMVEFFQAHQQDPTQLKPTGYWYGHPYTYLTRDMIDHAMKIIASSNRLIRRVKSARPSADSPTPDGTPTLQELTVPPLLDGTAKGCFLEFSHTGRNANHSNTQRIIKLGRWAAASWRLIRRKHEIEQEVLSESERLDEAWENNMVWAEKTLRIFGIEVRIKVDPAFREVADSLDLANGKQKVLFFPTHQSVFDHPVMYHVLQSQELLDALGWKTSRPCTFLSRSGLISYVAIRIGSWSTTLFGVSEQEFDRLLEDIDGYVVLPRSGDTGNATQRFADQLDQRPGIIYPAATVAAFGTQSIPLQHGLFSKIPPDVVIIPMAFRGIHSIWPKSPRRNIQINPGVVEVVISPPMSGETTLFPKRRTLRPQLEPAALFQAVQIVNLLNPDPKP